MLRNAPLEKMAEASNSDEGFSSALMDNYPFDPQQAYEEASVQDRQQQLPDENKAAGKGLLQEDIPSSSSHEVDLASHDETHKAIVHEVQQQQLFQSISVADNIQNNKPAEISQKIQAAEWQTEEAAKREEKLADLEQKCVKLEKQLAEKDSILESLKKAHEQIRASRGEVERSSQAEKEILVNDLEKYQRQCEENGRKVHDLESELAMQRSICLQLEDRCKAATQEATRQATLLTEREMVLDAKIADLNSLTEAVKHADGQKIRFMECERLLVQETAEKTMAQCALADIRNREEYLLTVEQAHKENQENMKWREERFQLLEAAHSKLKGRMEDERKAWEMERAEIFADMATLQIDFESKKRSEAELQMELRRIHQALAVEESRRKLLESQVAESRTNLEKVAAEYETVQSDAESLRLKTSLEIGTLRDALGSKERQLKDLQVRHTQLELENQEAAGMQEELQQLKKDKDGLQKALERSDQELCALRKVHERSVETLAAKERGWEMEKEEMLQSLSISERVSASSRAEMDNLVSELERSRLLAERFRDSNKDLSRKLEDLEMVLEKAEIRSNEASLALDNLQRKSTEDLQFIQDLLGIKEKKLRDAEGRIKQYQITVNDLTSKCVKLEEESLVCSTQEEDLKAKRQQLMVFQEAKDKLHAHVVELERRCTEEKEIFMAALEEANAKLSEKEKLMMELQAELERSRYLVSTLQTRLAEEERQKGSDRQELETAHEELRTIKISLEHLNSSSRAAKEALLGSLACKDQKLLELRTNLSELEKTVADLSTKQEQNFEMKCGFENLEQQINQRTLQLNESEKARNVLLVQFTEERNTWNQDREILICKLNDCQEQLTRKDDRLKGMQYDLERKAESKMKLDADCAALKERLDECSIQLQEATARIHESKMEIEAMCKEAQVLIESRNDIAAAKESTIEQLKIKIRELEMRYEEKEGETGCQSSQISCLEAQLQEYLRIQQDMQERMRAMNASLIEKDDELKKASTGYDALHGELVQCQEDSSSMQLKMHQQMLDVQETLSTSHRELKTLKDQLGQLRLEKDALLKELGQQGMDLDDAHKKNQRLLDANLSLEDSVKRLREKILDHVKEASENKATIEQLCGDLEKAQSGLTSQDQEIKALQAKIEVTDIMNQQLREKEAKLLSLEEMLGEARTALEDNEEKMVASEWTVQQLANEIIKVKARLAQKEREETILREQLSNAERKLRGKEGEVMEMECYCKTVLKENKLKKAEFEKVSNEVREMRKEASKWQEKEASLIARSNEVASTLEEKEAALAESDREVKRGRELQAVMEGALESLKLQLANEKKLSFAQRSEMDLLCKDLEEIRSDRESAKGQLKELQIKVEQLEQSSEHQVQELRQETYDLSLELTHTRENLKELEKVNKNLIEESLRIQRENEALQEHLVAKERTLDDMEMKLTNVQTEFMDQATLAEQRSVDLEAVRSQLLVLLEKQSCVEDNLNCLQGQLADMQIVQQKLELEKARVNGELEASNFKLVAKDKELRHLHNQVEQLQVVSSKQEESNNLISRLTEELKVATISSSDQVSRLSASLSTAETEAKALEEKLAFKESELQALQEKFITIESANLEYENKITEIRDELERTRSDFEKQTEKLQSSSFQIKTLEKDNTELKSVAKEEQKALQNRLEDARSAMHILKGRLEEQTQTQTSLKALNLRLQNDIEQAVADLKTEREIRESSAFAAGSLQKALDESQMNACLVAQKNEALTNEVEELTALIGELNAELKAQKESEKVLEAHSNRLQNDLEKAYSNLEIEKNRLQSLLQEKDALESDLINTKLKADFSIKEQESILQEKEVAYNILRDMDSKIETQKQRQMDLETVNETLLEDLKVANYELDREKKRAQSAAIAIEVLEKELIENKLKFKSVIEENRAIKRDLDTASSMISRLGDELEMQKTNQQSLEEANKKLQIDLALAQEEALARKSKLLEVITVLEKSQETSRELRAQMEILHKRLLNEDEDQHSICWLNEKIDPFAALPRDIGFFQRRTNCNGKVLSVPSGQQNHASPSELDEAESTMMQSCGDTDEELQHAKQSEQQISSWLRAEKEETQQRPTKELEAALLMVAGKIKTIEQLNEELDRLKSLLRKQEQRDRRECFGACDTMNKKAKMNHRGQLQDHLQGEEDDDEAQKSEPVISPDEYNHYLELCDSLLRKNIGLERRLDNLQRKNQILMQQMEELQQSPQVVTSGIYKQSFKGAKDSASNENASPEKDLKNAIRKRVSNTLQSRSSTPITDLSKVKTSWEAEHLTQIYCERKPLHVIQIPKRRRSNDENENHEISL
ncbi:hypothetical protein O6H91_17G000400 [Diphasiastrum complanatum]|uniref:Uncharacterized protein n=3 Tax=Diphasiastrum complanatum TaxID=34168 RepID=A0ACC2B3E3_DIPCM|nr:hypothetical protein O6H91_17G000400 [Diphasiastrum complanatum]KAJ7524318.1 hypothetical protein O6H91_17G000400 [Diphasiastrum complanatum]